VCRCQNTYSSVAVTADLVSGQPVAHVVLGFGPQANVKMDWVFVQSSGAWLADDSCCTAQGPSTSIYDPMDPARDEVARPMIRRCCDRRTRS
jgi:hypothetical protein